MKTKSRVADLARTYNSGENNASRCIGRRSFPKCDFFGRHSNQLEFCRNSLSFYSSYIIGVGRARKSEDDTVLPAKNEQVCPDKGMADGLNLSNQMAIQLNVITREKNLLNLRNFKRLGECEARRVLEISQPVKLAAVERRRRSWSLPERDLIGR